MKNLDASVFEQYNVDRTGKMAVYNYMKGNIVHLEEDIKKGKKAGVSEANLRQYKELLKVCVELQDKVTFSKPLDDNDRVSLELINRYNYAKNKQLEMQAFLLLVFILFSIVLSVFFK